MWLVHNEEKSNRSASDYFELLLTQYICSEYWLTFSYSSDLSDVMDKLLSLSNAQERIALQNNNFRKIKSKVKEIIESEIISKWKIIQVIWTWRHLEIQTTSDVDVKHILGKLTRFSVKSISWDGFWTLKNVWMWRFKEFYGFDPIPDYNQMWEDLREYLTARWERCWNLSNEEIKNMCNNNPLYKSWANGNSRKYQSKFNMLSCEWFNGLSNENKKKLINYMSDSNDPDLYVIIVNEAQFEPLIYKPINQYRYESDNVIEWRINSDKEFVIYVDNIPLYRVSTNCTNWLWISPFCQRVFIVK